MRAATLPENNLNARSGGRVLVDCLLAHGVERVFAVAGESYLNVLDALHDTPAIQTITCRHESGATFMAEAHGKLTGKAGVAFVTRGPGACNGSIGIHTAFQDSTPLVLFIGQVARDQEGREAFQEIDYRQMFAPIAKLALQVDEAARLPEFIARAFAVAESGRPGPVVIALPEDMLCDGVQIANAKPNHSHAASPAPAAMDRFFEALATAERPLVIVGGAPWDLASSEALQEFAETHHLPVASGFRRQDIFPNHSRSYVGDLGTGVNPKLLAMAKSADLIIALGARLGEMTSQGYSLLDIPVPQQRLIHIHSSADELGRVYHGELLIHAAPRQFVAALEGRFPIDGRRWAEWSRAGRDSYLEWQIPNAYQGSRLDLGACFVWLRENLPEEAILTTDAGNFSGWGHRFLQYSRRRRLLGPTNGAMGYSVPAGIAAKMARPDLPVISFVGDGGFMMTGQELATAIHHGVAPIIMLFNNGMYGTIRMHQERDYPGRVSATDLSNPDFTALARSYGALGFKVTQTAEFAPAVTEALSSGRPTIIELMMDPEHLTTSTSLSQIRAKAMAGK